MTVLAWWIEAAGRFVPTVGPCTLPRSRGILTHPPGCPRPPPRLQRERANIAAVGSFEPGIELWDMDVVDAVEPLATLGGADYAAARAAAGAADPGGGEAEAGASGADGKKKKKKKKKKGAAPEVRGQVEGDGVWAAASRHGGRSCRTYWLSKAHAVPCRGSACPPPPPRPDCGACPPPTPRPDCGAAQVPVRPGSHGDAVLGLAWNQAVRNVLASASGEHSRRSRHGRHGRRSSSSRRGSSPAGQCRPWGAQQRGQQAQPGEGPFACLPALPRPLPSPASAPRSPPSPPTPLVPLPLLLLQRTGRSRYGMCLARRASTRWATTRARCRRWRGTRQSLPCCSAAASTSAPAW